MNSDYLRVFRAFSDERRLRVLELLTQGEQCVCVLLEELDISQPTLSYHMKMLEILRKFFDFCDERERREFYVSIVLGVAAALFTAQKIPAIGVMLQAILAGSVTAKAILTSLVIDNAGVGRRLVAAEI